MIVAFVQFPLPAPLNEAAATQVPKYSDLAGLVRRHCVLSEDGRVAGGLHFWQDGATADRAYDANWHRRVRARYGAEPQIAWFSSPVAVDDEKARP